MRPFKKGRRGGENAIKEFLTESRFYLFHC